jgi:dTDP-4-dehydrorhamnose 3,5-epimerase
MRIEQTSIPDVWVLEPRLFADSRGWFFESFNEAELTRAGLEARFVQDNHSHSRRMVLRGLHYQIQQPQGKLVRAGSGEIYDVAVDLRADSSTFGKWTGLILSSENKRQLWIPPGFGHGFVVLSETADVLYKTTDYYAPQSERTIVWNDPDLQIAWPIHGDPVLSARDAAGIRLRDAEVFGRSGPVKVELAALSGPREDNCEPNRCEGRKTVIAPVGASWRNRRLRAAWNGVDTLA